MLSRESCLNAEWSFVVIILTNSLHVAFISALSNVPVEALDVSEDRLVDFLGSFSFTFLQATVVKRKTNAVVHRNCLI